MTAQGVLAAASVVFGWDRAELTGGGRFAPLVRDRHVAMTVAYLCTGASFAEVGVVFGRARSSVSEAVGGVWGRVGVDGSIRDDVFELVKAVAS